MSSIPVTVREIARVAGVSVGTVSRALKSQQGMSQATRDKVFEVARALGYDLGNLRGARLRRVLFVLHRQHGGQANLFYSAVLHGLEAACQEAGIALSFASLGPEQSVPELVRMHEPQGIVSAGYFEHEVLAALQACGLPLVAVDHWAESLPCINDDNFHGAYQAVRHLLDRGYQRIAFIGGPAQHHSIRQRERGYRKALFDAGVLADPDYTVTYNEGTDPSAASTHCMQQLMQLPRAPDAVFAFNDITALVALQYCQRQGLRVPQDVGVCGYDDIASAAAAHPALTTVAVDKQRLGREALAVLLASPTEAQEHIHPVDLVVRESCTGPEPRH